MKIACLQLNPVVGDIKGNITKALQAIETVKQVADVIVLTELYTTGYPPRDLLLWDDIVDENLQAKKVLVDCTKTFKGALIFGYVERNPVDGCKPLFNAVCVAQQGTILQQRYKTLLPTYDVFAERRYFEPGKMDDIVPVLIDIDGKKVPVGVIICEEGWNDAEFWKTHEYPFDPVDLMAQRGAKHIISINASPYRCDQDQPIAQTRRMMVRKHCLDHLIGFTYVNQVGANDDIVFDGNSFTMEIGGDITSHLHHCAEDIEIADTDRNRPVKEKIYTRPVEEDLLRVLVLGIKDYFDKQPFLKEAWLGLSGGIDSALVAFLGTQAIGAGRIITLGMPSKFSSDGSITDAEKLANRLGIDYYIAPIHKPHMAFQSVFDNFVLNKIDERRHGTMNGRAITTLQTAMSGVTDQNLQARIRDTMLMMGANKFDSLLLLTGNKSESAVGYYTLYDMCGGLGVISDVYKTMVYRLSRYINATAKEEIIPWNSINKKASAELAEGQTDQDTLPPYEWLDAILYRLVERHQSSRQIITEFATVENVAKYANETATDFGKARNLTNDIVWTCKTVIKQQWKRDQAARGLKSD